jgi:lipopolysaccharide exporter
VNRIYYFITEKLRLSFVKNVLTLLTGSVLGQGIMLLFMPLLTRLYPEEVFGLFFVYTSTSAILRIIAGLRFEMSIILPKNDAHAFNLLVFAVGINTFINLVFAGIVFIFGAVINDLLGENSMGNMLYFLPLSSFLLGSFEIFSYWNNRLEAYKKISFPRVYKSVAMGSAQSGFSFWDVIGNGLITGQIFGQFTAAFGIFLHSYKSLKSNAASFSLKKGCLLLKKYKSIPLFNSLISIYDVTSKHLPLLMLAAFFGPETAAFFGLAQKIIATPMGMVGQAISQVFFKQASDTYNRTKSLSAFTNKTYKNMFKLAVLPFICLFVLSYFFEYIFGGNWDTAGEYARYLLPWLFLGFINRPVFSVITILNKQKVVSFYNLALLIMRVSAVYIGYKVFDSALSAIVLLSAAGVIFNLFMFFYLNHISKSVKEAY